MRQAVNVYPAEPPLSVSLECDPSLTQLLRDAYPAFIPGYQPREHHTFRWQYPHMAGAGAVDLKPNELEQRAIDGKVLRGSHRHTPRSQNRQEVLHVFAVESGTLEYCQRIEGKGLEAVAAHSVVEQTDCRGVVITADALQTRPRFCRCIRQQKGHYVLMVKRNRAELEAEIRYRFALPPHRDFPLQSAETVEVGHGRITRRHL